MSNPIYKIHRWDSVLFGNNEYATPIIYVKPDDILFEFAKVNKDALLVRINSTESIYDNKRITGVFSSSSEIPNCRPVFFNKTGLYVIVLQAEWHGYPDSLGFCEIFGLKGGVPYKDVNDVPLQRLPSVQRPPERSVRAVENYSRTNGSCGMTSRTIIVICISIILILVLSLFLSKK